MKLLRLIEGHIKEIFSQSYFKNSIAALQIDSIEWPSNKENYETIVTNIQFIAVNIALQDLKSY